MAKLYTLFEHAVGFSLFKVKEFEEVGAFLPQVEEAAQDAAKFKKVVQLTAFKAFTNTTSALENMNAVSEGLMTDDLKAFIEHNLPKSGKHAKITLGVSDSKLSASISEALGINVTHIGVVPEIIRGIRFHLATFIKGLNAASMMQTELGLGHSYSRAKVKFNVNRVDQMIIQSIALIDLLDKDINTFAMRIREWYSYHFPELAKVVPDNHKYALCANYIKNRSSLTSESLEKLEEITMDSAMAQGILDAARMSMGMDISPIDLRNIEMFAIRVAKLSEYRKRLLDYLRSKMNNVAPNLATIIGDIVGARLISRAGSLTNLAKYPASTLQILGAEKALFRALKTRSNTPKYGLIYHSNFISKAGTKNKGRISRFLANKCSLASRIDCFSETLTNVFGERLKGQVDERLNFYETGDIPRKNTEVMEEAAEENVLAVKKALKRERKLRKSLKLSESSERENGELNYENEEVAVPVTPKKKKKKRSHGEMLERSVSEEVGQTVQHNGTPEQLETQHSEKKKKKKKQSLEVEEGSSSKSEAVEEPVSEKKKKKKKKDTELDGSYTEQIEQVQEPNSEKKKKKKRSLEVEDSYSAENVDVEEPVSEKKKKKKKKDIELEESYTEQMEQVQEPNSEKKKKKKRKSMQSTEE